ncbi:MAG: hypothetical protein PHF74_05615 [Dehalococcoidales bacterium]|nr:hypothetical protein [Dehalococcoidales bacterium]
MDKSKFSAWFQDAESAHNQFVKRAKEAVDFVLPNKQWDRETIDLLDQQKKPHLTINKIFPVVYFLSGYQRQNKFDLAAVQKKAESGMEAKILSECMKGIYDDEDAQYEVSDWFLTGCIKGLSWLGGYVDYEDDPIRGDLKLESLNPYDIYPDPNASKYSFSDGMYLFKKLWMTVDELRANFPKKVDDINATEITASDDIIYGEGDEYRDISDRTLILKHTEKIRVKECWYLKEKPVKYLVDRQTGEAVEFQGSDEEIRNIRAIKSGIIVIPRQKKILCLSTTIGETVLQDIENPIGEINRIPFVPFYAYRIDDNIFGVVDQLMDVQREVNKRRSQALHIVNTMTNNFWMIPESAGLSKDEFLQEASKVGGGVVYKGNQAPQNVGPTGAQGVQIAAYSAEAAEADIKEISGVNADLMGYKEGGKEPGIVLQLRQQQGAVVIEPIMDNFKYSNRILGSLLIDFIQKSGMYSPDEIVNITDAQGHPIEASVSAILNDKTMKKFKVAVSLQKSAPSLRMADFMKLTELVNMGVPIPPEVLIEASDVPMKEKILQAIQAAMQGVPGNANNPGGNPGPQT